MLVKIKGRPFYQRPGKPSELGINNIISFVPGLGTVIYKEPNFGIPSDPEFSTDIFIRVSADFYIEVAPNISFEQVEEMINESLALQGRK